MLFYYQENRSFASKKISLIICFIIICFVFKGGSDPGMVQQYTLLVYDSVFKFINSVISNPYLFYFIIFIINIFICLLLYLVYLLICSKKFNFRIDFLSIKKLNLKIVSLTGFSLIVFISATVLGSKVYSCSLNIVNEIICIDKYIDSCKNKNSLLLLPDDKQKYLLNVTYFDNIYKNLVVEKWDVFGKDIIDLKQTTVNISNFIFKQFYQNDSIFIDKNYITKKSIDFIVVDKSIEFSYISFVNIEEVQLKGVSTYKIYKNLDNKFFNFKINKNY